MLTPNGQAASKIEKVMLLALWANALKENLDIEEPGLSKKLIFAGLGKPTYPIHSATIQSYLSYWQRLDCLTKQWQFDPNSVTQNPAISYGDPRGDLLPRQIMALAMSSWYEVEITADELFFTVGGIAALRIIFETCSELFEDIPGYRIISPFPHYSAYANNRLHRLHPIDMMQESGYKLRAEALEASIIEAYRLAEIDGGKPRALLICNPSNPLGNIIDETELYKIAEVLRRYPELLIIFDEAYAEMTYIEMPSFIKIAPDLKSRVILLRSATKALSAAGERMAMLMVFDKSLMNEFLHKNISYTVHAPRSAQLAYAETMKDFSIHDRLKMAEYYKQKVDYVMDRLKKMGASMPDPLYTVEGSFYALADLSDLMGLELPASSEKALQKTGTVQTGEDIAYYLLFQDSIMLAPLSYFGLAADCGFMRITCSADVAELKEMMDRLEQRLIWARSIRKKSSMHLCHLEASY